MEVVRQENAHRLDVGVRQQVAVAGVDPGNVVGLAALLAPLVDRLSAGDAAGKALGFECGEALQVPCRDAAQSDEPDLKHSACSP